MDATLAVFLIGFLTPILMYVSAMVWASIFEYIDVKLRLKRDRKKFDAYKKDIMATYDKYKDEFDIDEPDLDNIK